MRKVSVVISTYSIERAIYLRDCIESLRRQTLLPTEIILVLDPDDSLVDFYKELFLKDVKIVVSRGFGLSCARNAGVKNANGEIVAFIDDDAFADKRWLEDLVKDYDSPNVLGIGGHIKPLWENGRPFWFPDELDWVIGCSYKGLPEHKTGVRNPIGCNMSFRRDVFEDVGYFETGVGRVGNKLVAGEEAELSIRILQKNPCSKILHNPSALVFHRVPKRRTSLWYMVIRSFHEGYSKAIIASSRRSSLKDLNTEVGYLGYLLRSAFPMRLKQLHKLECDCQSFILLLSISSVLFGYFVGRLKSV